MSFQSPRCTPRLRLAMQFCCRLKCKSRIVPSFDAWQSRSARSLSEQRRVRTLGLIASHANGCDMRDQWSCGRSHLLFIERALKILASQAGKLHLNALLAESMNTVNCVIYLFDLNRFSNTQKSNFSFDPLEFSLFTPPCRVRWRKINWKESIIKGTGARVNAKNGFDSITARKGKRDLCGWIFIMRQLGLRGLINYSPRRPSMSLFALSFYIPKK